MEWRGVSGCFEHWEPRNCWIVKSLKRGVSSLTFVDPVGRGRRAWRGVLPFAWIDFNGAEALGVFVIYLRDGLVCRGDEGDDNRIAVALGPLLSILLLWKYDTYWKVGRWQDFNCSWVWDFADGGCCSDRMWHEVGLVSMLSVYLGLWRMLGVCWRDAGEEKARVFCVCVASRHPRREGTWISTPLIMSKRRRDLNHTDWLDSGSGGKHRMKNKVSFLDLYACA